MASLVDKYFAPSDFDDIEAAVRKAELFTSGEIAVELSARSRNWGMERAIHALGWALICAAIGLYVTRDVDWGVYYSTTQAVLWGTIGYIAAWFGWGQILKRGERRRRVVWERARRLLHELPPTKGKTAVLILVSLEERRVAIVADRGIATKLPADYWDTPHAMIVDAVIQGSPGSGIVKAIETIATELARHFPREDDDINELPDAPTRTD
jgi:putative membrane protein